jgi:transcriptional regulator with XRE-family HTH domain
MDAVRIGLSLRALRRRRHLTQSALGALVGLSHSTIARVERGHADRVTLSTLIRIANALGASVSVRVLWHGEALDRMLDAAHADITDLVLRLLRDAGWDVATAVSFNVRGECGVIDVLAFHPSSGALLVIEIKSVVPDLQAMLGTLDRKVLIARSVAQDRGWRAARVSRLLVLPDDRTARRRVERHSAVFATALPARMAAVRRWLKRPGDVLAGILFLPHVHPMSTRHRVVARRGVTDRELGAQM